MRVLGLVLLAALSASATKHDGLPDQVVDVFADKPPPPPPAPSCNKVAGCYGHGTCTATLPGGTCKCDVGFAPSPPSSKGVVQECAVPSAALIALEQKYNATRLAACAKVVAKAPTLDATDAASFMAAYQGFMGNSSEAPVIAAAAKLMADPKLTAFLSLPDSFSAADGLDAAMVKCALMTGAHHGGGVKQTSQLAVFAIQSAANEALVEKLLGDTLLMRDLLVAGTEYIGGRYGEAMALYEKLLAASSELRAAAAAPPPAAALWDDREPSNVLKRLALGTALGLAPSASGASPVSVRFQHVPVQVDPVKRYLHYEAAYKAGALDPAFPVLTTFELSATIDADSFDEDFTWVRETMANFRPDNIATDYQWRYAESVHTDVAYGDSHCAKFNNGTGGVCNGHYSDVPVGGDVCGGRAFWGRFVCKAFGRPTWGATEHAHAAMSAWTPTGWVVLLGAPWPDCWSGPRGGEDFHLEASARETRAEFQKILRGSWVALAKDEAPVNGMWHEQAKGEDRATAPANGKGGLWSALMLYMKKAIVVAQTGPLAINRTIPSDPSNAIQKIVTRFAAAPAPPAPITTSADGTITIPAASFTSKNHSAPVSVMTSADEGTQLLSNGCVSSAGPPCFQPLSSSWTYDVTAKTAGKFYLTANFSTYHMDQDLWVTVNDAKPVELGMYYTIGWWNETQSTEVSLLNGKNTLTFTRLSDRDVMYKEFFLYTKKPDLPAPPANYTPSPPPPAPSADDYIEVAASTTCTEQGIHPVSSQDCSHACLALGFKGTGPRARANISGCFVMTEGPYAGNCNFNTNLSATCTPPCTLMGSIVRSICTRK
jgi:hypothetical protein